MISTSSNFSKVAPRAVKLKEAASYLGISPSSMRRLIKRGLIKPNRSLRHQIIPVVELDRFLTEGQE
jgi:hypothetical protein